MTPHSQKKRKELGAYYTPLDLSQALTDWAITSPDDQILEPSFGGCGFLEASIATLESLGAKNPTSNLYGADIDHHAFKFLSNKLGTFINVKQGKFIRKDFLKLSPNSFPTQEFETIIGNPPYISNHNMSKPQRKSCAKVAEKSSFIDKTLGMNASLWAYFIIHSLSFLKRRGRVAWVLPSSLLNTYYSKNVIDIHKKHFQSVKLIKLHTRYFQESGADEVSVVLLAENFHKKGHNNSTLSFHTANDVIELETFITKVTEPLAHDRENYKLTIIDRDDVESFYKVVHSNGSSKLKDLCNIRIGMVTGDNSTFIINSSTKLEYNLSDTCLSPVIGRFSHLTGLIHTESRHKKLIDNDLRCLLVCPSTINRRRTSIRQYLSTVNKDKRKNNKTFPKRESWFYPDDHKYPDAFFSYMTHEGPRMVINQAKYNCTNSIHRIYFKENMKAWMKKALALSLLSSFSQLSAEIEGRSYGSGVLKLEPNSANQIAIFSNEATLLALYNASSQITPHIDKGEFDTAREVIDEIISRHSEIPYEILKRFSYCIERLRKDRYKGVKP